MKNLKIAYLALSENYGEKHAGFTHTYNITKNLGSYLKIDVFFSNNRIGLIKKEKNTNYYGVKIPSLKNLLNVFSFFKSYFYMNNIIKNADLIHERFHINPIDLLFVNKPYILEINDPAMVLYSGIKGFLYKKLINLKLKRADAIITQTETLKAILKNYFHKDIFVISNGVDTKKFNSNFKKSNKEIIVAYSGAFMQWHGVQDIIELAKEFRNIKFLLIGNGPLFDEIKKNKLKNIILTGSVDYDEVPKYLAKSDILIAPFNTSRFKHLEKYGFWWCPVKLFEYLAMGKPIISYNYKEVKNIVENSGLLAEPGNLEDFKNKLRILINNKNLRIELGKKARKLSLKYDWKNKALETMKVYEKTIN